MRRTGFIVFIVASLVLSVVAAAWSQAWIALPGQSRYAELNTQLRDRAAVAYVGHRPWGILNSTTPMVPVGRVPALATALASNRSESVAAAIRQGHVDGLLVPTDGSGGSGVAGALSRMRPSPGLTAVYLDEQSAIYEPSERPALSHDDAQRLIAVARLILSGATAPPERLFSEPIRQLRPVEVALVIRNGHDAVLWRSTRAGSIARAFLDVCFAVLDRWSTRQQERFGRLRDGLRTLSLSLAVFYDKGVLGTRSPEFLRRAADPRVWGVGYERTTSWEYVLPPTPWSHEADPARSLVTLGRDRGLPEPGYLRPEITVYRFRALQMIEAAPGGPVDFYDPE